jgi:hypothetical protein
MAAVTGCSQFDAALGQQQLLVSFKAGTPNSERLQVRSACGSLPNVKKTPIANLKREPYALNQLTYQVNKASTADIARLEECLSKFTSVAGVTLHDSSDDGS